VYVKKPWEADYTYRCRVLNLFMQGYDTSHIQKNIESPRQIGSSIQEYHLHIIGNGSNTRPRKRFSKTEQLEFYTS
jgi:hypothetical protein